MEEGSGNQFRSDRREDQRDHGQTGTNNSVISATDQSKVDFHAEQCTFNINQPAPPPAQLSDTEAQGYIEEFLDACSKDLEEKVKERIIGRFEHLEDPDGAWVNPDMQLCKFYDGDTALDPGEYIPDPIFASHCQRKVSGDKIKLEHLHQDAGGMSCNYVALVADAGAGKTTLAKRYASLVSEGKIDKLRDVELVLYINFAQLDPEKEYTLFNLLFKEQIRGLSGKEKAMEYGRLWVQKNSKKILFVFDGLDQVEWKLKPGVKISFDTAKKAPALIYNLFHENLLPKCKILLTSREHAIVHFDGKSRPDCIVSLVGLSIKNIRILIHQLSPTKSDRIIEHLENKSPGLLSLCVNPMFLVFTIAILAENMVDAPETMSGILLRVLYYFIRSENRRADNNTLRQVLEKLAQLAYGGTKRKRVIFTRREITDIGLDPEQVKDFVIETPKAGTGGHYRLMEGNLRLFFCHQSVQEALSAIEISKKSVEDFRHFLDEDAGNCHWEVVLRILLGTVLNKETSNEVQNLLNHDSVSEEKQNYLKEWLRKVIQRSQGRPHNRKSKLDDPGNIPYLRTERLCTLLYECGNEVNEIIESNIHTIVIKKRLRADQFHAVSWVLSHWGPDVKPEISSGRVGCSEDLLSRGLQNCRGAEISFSKWSLNIVDQIRDKHENSREIKKIFLIFKDLSAERPFDILKKILNSTNIEGHLLTVLHRLEIEILAARRGPNSTNHLTAEQIEQLIENNVTKIKKISLSITREFTEFWIDVLRKILDATNFEGNLGTIVQLLDIQDPDCCRLRLEQLELLKGTNVTKVKKISLNFKEQSAEHLFDVLIKMLNSINTEGNLVTVVQLLEIEIQEARRGLHPLNHLTEEQIEQLIDANVNKIEKISLIIKGEFAEYWTSVLWKILDSTNIERNLMTVFQLLEIQQHNCYHLRLGQLELLKEDNVIKVEKISLNTKEGSAEHLIAVLVKMLDSTNTEGNLLTVVELLEIEIQEARRGLHPPNHLTEQQIERLINITKNEKISLIIKGGFAEYWIYVLRKILDASNIEGHLMTVVQLLDIQDPNCCRLRLERMEPLKEANVTKIEKISFNTEEGFAKHPIAALMKILDSTNTEGNLLTVVQLLEIEIQEARRGWHPPNHLTGEEIEQLINITKIEKISLIIKGGFAEYWIDVLRKMLDASNIEGHLMTVVQLLDIQDPNSCRLRLERMEPLKEANVTKIEEISLNTKEGFAEHPIAALMKILDSTNTEGNTLTVVELLEIEIQEARHGLHPPNHVTEEQIERLINITKIEKISLIVEGGFAEYWIDVLRKILDPTTIEGNLGTVVQLLEIKDPNWCRLRLEQMEPLKEANVTKINRITLNTKEGFAEHPITALMKILDSINTEGNLLTVVELLEIEIQEARRGLHPPNHPTEEQIERLINITKIKKISLIVEGGFAEYWIDVLRKMLDATNIEGNLMMVVQLLDIQDPNHNHLRLEQIEQLKEANVTKIKEISLSIQEEFDENQIFVLRKMLDLTNINGNLGTIVQLLEIEICNPRTIFYHNYNRRGLKIIEQLKKANDIKVKVLRFRIPSMFSEPSPLSFNVDVYQAIGELTNHWKVEKLELRSSNLNEEQEKALLRGLGGHIKHVEVVTGDGPLTRTISGNRTADSPIQTETDGCTSTSSS